MMTQQIQQQNVSALLPQPTISITTGGKSKTDLPSGNWLLQVTEGSAWVFCNGLDVVIHAGETIEIRADQTIASIRNLNARESVTYTLTPRQ